MTEQEAKKLRRLILAFAEAKESDSWKGGSDPADRPYIEKRLKNARMKLAKFIQSLTKKEVK